MDKKYWYNHTMEYYAVIKRNVLVSHVNMWMNLKYIFQRGRNHPEKSKYSLIQFI